MVVKEKEGIRYVAIEYQRLSLIEIIFVNYQTRKL